jgi:large subunit ribosomal protein L30
VRIRGTIRAPRQVRETLEMLGLKRNNHAVLMDNRQSFLGMLKVAQNFVTWGEASEEAVDILIRKRGRLLGDKRFTDKYAQTIGEKSLEKLVKKIYKCDVQYGKLPNVKPIFKLSPPAKGFKGKVKKSYGMGGESGYRGERINELIKRMT